jgi:hypothetical protein
MEARLRVGAVVPATATQDVAIDGHEVLVPHAFSSIVLLGSAQQLAGSGGLSGRNGPQGLCRSHGPF